MLLDGEESEMIFIDHPSSEMSVSWQITPELKTLAIGFGRKVGVHAAISGAMDIKKLNTAHTKERKMYRRPFVVPREVAGENFAAN